jgi:hypothetical protein
MKQDYNINKKHFSRNKDEYNDGIDSLSRYRNKIRQLLDVLKLKESEETYKKVMEDIQQIKFTLNNYKPWITIIKIVADSCVVNKHIFSQSELCDFLTIATKGIEQKEERLAGTRMETDVTFNIYKDIMENYQNFQNSLMVDYPRIIVDVISILERGTDTKGKKVGLYGAERYYQIRKSEAMEKVLLQIPSTLSYPSEDYDEEKEGLIESLNQITSRNKRELVESVANLPNSDTKKLSDLCLNYSKLQKYCELISNEEEFRCEVQKELGRELTDNQLQHAIISIRKIKTYIESVLDGKFIPHDTHGINHVRHNLEYGYKLMGLIESERRRQQ